jgi:hypothetical protein
MPYHVGYDYLGTGFPKLFERMVLGYESNERKAHNKPMEQSQHPAQAGKGNDRPEEEDTKKGSIEKGKNAANAKMYDKPRQQ